MRFIPPAGTPIGIQELASWIRTSLPGARVLDQFAFAVRSKMDIRHCFFLSSGRAALALIVKGLYQMRNEPGRNEIILPAYTCYSVPGSVIKAGLKVRICDVNPTTLSYKAEAMLRLFYSSNFLNAYLCCLRYVFGNAGSPKPYPCGLRSFGWYFVPKR